MWYSVIAALLTAAMAGCDLAEVTTSPSDDVLVVEAVLRTDEPVQRVLIHRSLHSGEEGADIDAEVSVTTESGRVMPFHPAPLQACTEGLMGEEQGTTITPATCFLSTPITGPWVETREAYALSVHAEDGRVIRGRTTVPGEFRFVLPNVQASRGYTCRIPPYTNLSLVWTAAENAWSYLTVLVVLGLDVALAHTGIVAPGRIVLRGVVSARDTTKSLPADFIFDRLDLERDLLLAIRDGFPEGTFLDVRVVAADRNSVNAIRGGAFNPSGHVRVSSVVGDGVGYFGSQVPLQLGIAVTAEEGGYPPCSPAA